MRELLANSLIWIGLLLFFVGMLCFFICKQFSAKLLVTSIIDSCGMLTMLVGVMIRLGLTLDTLKVGLILATILIISAITSHEITRLTRNKEEEYREEAEEGESA